MIMSAPIFDSNLITVCVPFCIPLCVPLCVPFCVPICIPFCVPICVSPGGYLHLRLGQSERRLDLLSSPSMNPKCPHPEVEITTHC